MLERLKPKEVFHYFEALTRIPRGSGNEKQVSDFLVDFARQRKLEVFQDEALNVIIRKPGTAGYEHSAAVILQGHMDMVCEKAKGVRHDFTKDPLTLKIEGDFVRADGTTLGVRTGPPGQPGYPPPAARTARHHQRRDRDGRGPCPQD